MNRLSKLVNRLKGSEIIRLNATIRQLLQQGRKVYNYTIGDFDPKIFPIPARLKREIIQAYEEDNTNYPPAEGVLALREAVSAYVRKTQGLQYTTDEVLIASGGRPLIYTVFQTIVDPGDKVIYPVPSWNNNHYCNISGAVPCEVVTLPEEDFMPSPECLAQYIKDAVLLCLCTPQNPTGTILKQSALEEIINLVVEENRRRKPEEKKLYVMFDQMYGSLVYGDQQHVNPVTLCPEMKEYTIFIDGISKAFAATGVRVGWALGPPLLISKMKLLLGHIGGWSPLPEQMATASFLDDDAAVAEFMTGYRNALEEPLGMLYKGFLELKERGYPVDVIKPVAAIYLTIKLDLVGYSTSKGVLRSQSDVTEYILNTANLGLVPFQAFGAGAESPWYRLSVGTCVKGEIPQMLAQLEVALQGCGCSDAIPRSVTQVEALGAQLE